MIRPTSMPIRRMNSSPRVRIHSAVPGHSQPITAPNTMPANTCTDMSM
jgi:hypothetical protein